MVKCSKQPERGITFQDADGMGSENQLPVSRRIRPGGTALQMYVKAWDPDSLVISKWESVQNFIEKYHPVLFSLKNLKLLYKNDREMIGRYGSNIFMDVFLYVLFSNMIVFCKKYKADIVSRIISTLISVSSERDLLNYIYQLNTQLGKIADFPVLVKNEDEMSGILCTLKW